MDFTLIALMINYCGFLLAPYWLSIGFLLAPLLDPLLAPPIVVTSVVILLDDKKLHLKNIQLWPCGYYWLLRKNKIFTPFIIILSKTHV